MRRRTFITLAGGLATWPLAARAQAPGKVWRIGMLETASIEQNSANLDAFRAGLRDLGYVEGQNFILEYRAVADGRTERFRGFAAELVRLPVDLIVVRSTPAVLAAKEATLTIPIVMAASADPLAVVGDLSHPGGNVTGLSAFTFELVPKLIELLKDIVPGMMRVAVLVNLDNPPAALRWDLAQTAGRALGIQPLLLGVRARDEIQPAFEAAIRQRADGIITGVDALLRSNLRLVVDLAAAHKLPAIYPGREFVEVGGLMSYGADFPRLYFRAASFVDKIFKGAKAGDLPVEQPTEVEMVINQRTARALGLTIPQSVLLRADAVIE